MINSQYPDDDLAIRAARSAAHAGQTQHDLMLGAVSHGTEQSEQDRRFQGLADQRWAGLVETGMSIAWDDAKAWLLARAEGENPPPPVPRRISL
jgi:hypothetical protein